MTLRLTPNIEGALTEIAHRQGTTPEQLANELLGDTLDMLLQDHNQKHNQGAGGAAWEVLLRSEIVSVPAIPPEALRRESLYRDDEA